MLKELKKCPEHIVQGREQIAVDNELVGRRDLLPGPASSPVLMDRQSFREVSSKEMKVS